MQKWCLRVVDSKSFQSFIIGVIVIAGILVGLETYPEIAEQCHSFLVVADKLVIAIFVVEIAMKMAALSPKSVDFFKDPWNVFDFLIVAVCLVPGLSGFGPVLRLVRLLRVLRLLTAVPKLQLLVAALLKSLPSMIYVTILLSLVFYIYAVAGVVLFSKNDPVHFGDIGISLLTLFRVVTLEDWTDVMYLQIYGSDNYAGYNLNDPLLLKYTFEPRAMPVVAIVYFVTFVLTGTMIMLNLVIGVIINGMDDARIEAEIETIKAAEKALGKSDALNVENQVKLLSKQIKELQGSIHRLGKTLPKTDID